MRCTEGQYADLHLSDKVVVQQTNLDLNGLQRRCVSKHHGAAHTVQTLRDAALQLGSTIHKRTQVADRPVANRTQTELHKANASGHHLFRHSELQITRTVQLRSHRSSASGNHTRTTARSALPFLTPASVSEKFNRCSLSYFRLSELRFTYAKAARTSAQQRHSTLSFNRSQLGWAYLFLSFALCNKR